MLNRIKSLAQLVRVGREQKSKHVLMLGAGASIASGVPSTERIMEAIAKDYGSSDDLNLSPLERFDLAWDAIAKEHRRGILSKYLLQTPSIGYHRLADLIRLSYFDLIITFNFDELLEQSLLAVGVQYEVLNHAELASGTFDQRVENRTPRVKVLKMHGSLNGAGRLVFSQRDLVAYPADVEGVLQRLTGRSMIMCGYGCNDLCVVRAFAKEGGSIHCVNPAGVPPYVLGIVKSRNSGGYSIRGDAGMFDSFFTTLHRELTAPTPHAHERLNTFKFLDHYQEDQQDWYRGRAALKRELATLLRAPDSQVLVVSGLPQVGKTSFMRAALIPRLISEGLDCMYLRSSSDLESVLSRELSRRHAGGDFGEMIEGAKRQARSRLIIVIDQFERFCRAQKASEAELQSNLLKSLVARTDARLALVLVGANEVPMWMFLAQTLGPAQYRKVQIEPLSRRRVAGIIRHLGRRGGVEIDRPQIQWLCEKYCTSMELAKGNFQRPTFTLNHVQTLCYYFMKGSIRDSDGFVQPPPGLAAALESLQDDSGLLELLEGLGPDRRAILRGMLKLICDQDSGSRRLVETVRTKFSEISTDRFPEPLA